jgi:RNase adapter protein RapZ
MPAPMTLVLVTGPAGSGRTTALKAFEDLGFEAIDNMPATLVPRLVSAPLTRPLALALDARNRDFSPAALLDLVQELAALPGLAVELLYLSCSADVLIRRFSETRRRHPLHPDAPLDVGVAQELALLAPLHARSDRLIDTFNMTPHDLRARIVHLYGPDLDVQGGLGLSIEIGSFSYKRGLPEGASMVFDCRFLRNPHWDPVLRPRDGRDADVAAYVTQDPAFAPFFDGMHALVANLIPAFAREGKSHLFIAFGCTGGRHRSVAVAEKLAQALALTEPRVSKHHRELDRVAAPVSEPRHVG